jgi:hypothetical protein
MKFAKTWSRLNHKQSISQRNKPSMAEKLASEEATS